jgi:uroporphyrin-III C-methyltransferase/precorrin-2 dehydrogenase/sirohydrochlorin ferrochelatase/uroporphyrin-III C-methyltransferase
VSQQPATVYIVGAGPGDPELLTLKARRLLTEADTVVYDLLVSQPILDMIPADATRVFAGKAARNHHMPQEDINALLVSQAQAGRKVVRLKGGDPFIFGRGSEEAAFLAAHGVPFEIVPGITASQGCSAYAGIPLTHRGLAQGVHFVTGHCQEGKDLELNWKTLADPDVTLVIYMGLTNIQRIRDELVAAGLAQETPAAAIRNGTTPRQETMLTTLGGLPDCVERAQLKSPTLIVIGKVVALARELGWRGPAKECDG